MLVALSSTGVAQSADPSSFDAQQAPTEYREVVKQGSQEFGLGNYAEARSLFERAHALYPNARTLRALGLAEFELRNYALAVEHFEEALASREKPLSAEARESTESVLHRAKRFLGRVRIRVEPATAVVILDGQPLEHNESEGLMLSVGDHVLEFRATGFANERRALRIVGGETEDIAVVLSALGTPVAAEREPNRAPVVRRWWLWTTVGVVVAAGVGTAVWLAMREPKTRYEYQAAPGTLTDHGLRLPEN